MDRCLNPIQQINLLGSYDDESICLASAALGLSLMGNQPMSFYTDHLAELSDAVAAYYASIAGGDLHADESDNNSHHDIKKKLRSIQAVIYDQYNYHGNYDHYEELENADLCSVIERRKGMPIPLGIICMHVAKAQGWNIVGIGLPGHFICRLEANGERIIFDPFHNASIVNAVDLRRLLKLALGSEAELKPEHYQAISNRKTLLRLQNNIKQRQVDKHNFLDAIITLDTMRKIAPDEAELLLDAGQLYAQAKQPRAAINALSRYLDRSPSQYGRTKASVLIQQMKRQLD
ncbi:MAG: tetratricopeptide repeat protein [Cellvibrionales bacterium]|nr:tetratricopeptide repeat protein [Cellvibrionales bacterium]